MERDSGNSAVKLQQAAAHQLERPVDTGSPSPFVEPDPSALPFPGSSEWTDAPQHIVAWVILSHSPETS
jgi:hypothetical protein